MNKLRALIRRKVQVRDGGKRRTSDKSKWLSVLLFFACAVPGLFLLMASTFQLFSSLYDPSVSDVHLHPLVLVITALAGGLLMLAGVGLWKQWAYLLVFAAIPGSLFLLIMFNTRGAAISFSLATIVALCTFAALYCVRRFYRNRSPRFRNDDKSKPE